MPKLLNLGCGQRFHSDWVNVDMVSRDRSVIAHNLLKSVPFPDSYFDAVYHSHLLEHLPRAQAIRLVRECYRVLKPGGILRVAVPDLERIVRTYLEILPKALAGDKGARQNYEWIMLELYDQTVREGNGGAMARYLQQKELPNEDFILSRVGREAQNIRNDHFRVQAEIGFKKHLRGAKSLLNKVINKVSSKIKFLEYYRLGKFRRSGEIHQWMYDRYSLAESLEKAGFVQMSVCNAFTSNIPDWQKYELDGSQGKVYKPDSLYMEGVKPL